jgi:hypothetical protein
MPLGVILIKRKKTRRAGIAQLVEQWTENPRVTSSNLVPGIKKRQYNSTALFYGDLWWFLGQSAVKSQKLIHCVKL